MSESNVRTNDMAGSLWRLLKVWGPASVIFILSGILGWWGLTIGWTVALTWMGSLCVLNARQCNRVHCKFTGPFFLFMAAVTLLAGFRVISFGPNTWSMLGVIIIAGGVTLWIITEFIWGKYWGEAND